MKRTLLALVLLGGCGGGDSTETPDAVPLPPDASQADAPLTCEPTAALPYEWRPIEAVSTGGINLTTDTSGITSGTIDATAGGSAAAAENPYIYIDLTNGTKVAITDVDSYTQSSWDIALKRYVIRANSGDSGPGGVEVALAGGTSLAEVTSIPAANEFGADDWSDSACELRAGPLGEPETAFGGWYAYDSSTHAVTPNAFVYVIRLRDGTYRKFRIITYYGFPTDATRGAYYEVEWAPLS
jgi:hypothetical protein